MTSKNEYNKQIIQILDFHEVGKWMSYSKCKEIKNKLSHKLTNLSTI